VKNPELQEKMRGVGKHPANERHASSNYRAREIGFGAFLAAGIAHEIKILKLCNNFAELSVELTQELLEEIEDQKRPSRPESREYIEEILDDLSQNAKKNQ